MRYIIFILIGACSYGILSTLAKLSYNAGFLPSDATGTQMFFGLIMMWVIIFIDKKNNQKVTIKPVLQYMLMGLPIGLTSIFYYICVQHLPASIAILLLFQFIWIGLLIDGIATKKWPSLIHIISVVILLFGTYFAAGVDSNVSNTYDWKGIIYGLLSGVSYAFFIFFNGKSGVKLSAPQKSGFMLIGATILCFVVFPPYFIFNGSLSNGLLKYGIPLALFGAVIPPLLYAIAVPKVGTTLSSILSAAELPSAVLVATIFLQEKVSLMQWMGILIIIGGVILPGLVKIYKEKRMNKKNVDHKKVHST